MKPKPLMLLSNSQFYVLEWISIHDGEPRELSKGKTLDALLAMEAVRIEDDKVFITEAGRAALKGSD